MLAWYNPDSTSFKLLYLFYDFDYLNNLKILTPEVDLLEKLTVFTNLKQKILGVLIRFRPSRMHLILVWTLEHNPNS